MELLQQLTNGQFQPVVTNMVSIAAVYKTEGVHGINGHITLLSLLMRELRSFLLLRVSLNISSVSPKHQQINSATYAGVPKQGTRINNLMVLGSF